jgi:predicted metal-dependent HD superfamily phosphohydrolase
MIQSEFYSSLKRYTSLTGKQDALWREVEQAYTESGRHYHTLSHLDNLLTELKPFQNEFYHWDTIVFATTYHDMVYNVVNSNNEEQSAALAESRLMDIGFPAIEIEHCKRLIRATQQHEEDEPWVNLFTDADLSILGAEPDAYQQYAKQVRKEYSIFPDMIYQPGRKKVIAHFLRMPRIFKTQEFFDLYEVKARINLQAESEELG